MMFGPSPLCFTCYIGRAEPVMPYMFIVRAEPVMCCMLYCSGRARYVFQVTVDMVATVVGRYAARFTGGDDG